ncbi:MAG: prolyl oligopeptidase family serine peptidase [Fimbriimonadaceae bacterium]
MRRFGLLVLLVPALGLGQMNYPDSKRLDLIETIHNTDVADPYRWLEEDSAETKAWVSAQSEFTNRYLASLPYRKEISSKLSGLINYERFTVPGKKGGKYFYSRNDGLQNQSVLYVATSLTAKPRVLLDPNKLSTDGTVALSGLSASDNGRLLAYGTSASGSDWQEWHVRNVSTGKDLTDHLKWVKFSGASWSKDNKGFFYARYDEPKGQAMQEQNYYQKLYYHRIGTLQSQDILVYERKDQREWGFDGTVTEDGRYLVISVWQGTLPENRVYVADISRGISSPLKVIKLFDKRDASYTYLGNTGKTFYFQTNLKAPFGRIVSANLDTMATKTVIAQSGEAMEGASMVGGRIVAQYLQHASSKVKVFTPSGKLVREVALPGIGSVSGFAGRFDDSETFYSYASYTSPTTIYRYDLKSGESKVYRRPNVKFDPAKFETKQVFAKSKDGTRVPIFITGRKGFKLDGNNPTLMYGYGGFNSNTTPHFSAITLTWLEMGGLYADVVLRGGTEYGEAWHKAGMLHNKQNVFDDFIAAGEFLIRERFTSTPKLAINGGSNGGLLVGACLTQRPDLFGAALPAVGVMDMLRFQKFTIGWAWQGEYGYPEKSYDDFKYLLGYSPYHNIKEGTKYPPTLITTADHDDRVVPAHSFKFAAAIQHAQAGTAPVLIRIETKAGHGAGKPITKVIEEWADQYAFLVKHLGFKPRL